MIHDTYYLFRSSLVRIGFWFGIGYWISNILCDSIWNWAVSLFAKSAPKTVIYILPLLRV